MCGILGSINVPFDGAALDLIQHRGPDSSGFEQFTVGPHHVYFGHRRLAIVDLTVAGHQPMSSINRDASLIYNGEVYNHAELRRSLREVPFRGHSDTESVLYALREFGIQAAAGFNGIFAFAFLDHRLKKLYLARDPFGVKPLYYRRKGNGLVFGSELRPLIKLIPDELDRENLALALKLRYTPSPKTLFKDTARLRPGHVLEVNLSGRDLRTREFCYITSDYLQESMSLNDAVSRYGELLEAAVQRQLMSDVDVGILLSGGVDSALIAMLAKENSTSALHTFTIGFNEKSDADEIPEAAETARLLGLPHHPIQINQGDFFSALETCTAIVEEPLATTSIIPMYYLTQKVSKQMKVVLSGQGADEQLGGYRRYQGELIASRLPAFLARAALDIASYTNFESEPIVKGLRAACTPDDLERFVSSYTVFENDDIERLIGQPDHSSKKLLKYFYDQLALADRANSVERMMSLDLRTNLPDDLLLYTDKISMHHSLECRVPMLDLDVVKFVESLPARYRVTARTGKRIHKLFAEKKLPREIVNRPKKGFASPTATWFRKGDRLREILLSRCSTFASIFDLNHVEMIIRQHEGGRNREKQLFMLLSCYFWFAAMP